MRIKLFILGLITCLFSSCGTSTDDIAKNDKNIFIRRIALTILSSGSDTSGEDSSEDQSSAFKEIREAFEELGLKVHSVYVNNGSNPSLDVACSDDMGKTDIRMFADEKGTMLNFYGVLQFKVGATFDEVTYYLENTDLTPLSKALQHDKEDIKDDYVLFNSIDPDYEMVLVNKGHSLYDDEPVLSTKIGDKEVFYVKRYYSITGTTMKIKVVADNAEWGGLPKKDEVNKSCIITIGINKNVLEKM